MNWGYETDHPFDDEATLFREHHVPFYVCPGTSSWNRLAGRVNNMLQNCLRAAEADIKNGAAGYLLTDWGDNGHWQQLPISYPGFAVGAAFSWCLVVNWDINLSEILNNIIFKDYTNQIGDLIIDIRNEYQSWGIPTINSSPLFWFLQAKREKLQEFSTIHAGLIYQSLTRLENHLVKLDNIVLNRLDADIIKSELKLTIQLTIHARKCCL